MARALKIIQQQIIDNLVAKGIYVSNNFFSRRRLWTYVVAFCMNIEESLWDIFKIETDNTIKAMKLHTERWYATVALLFQYGFNLIPDTNQFDNTGYTDEQVAASMIIKYAAVTEQSNAFGRLYLRIKLATDNGADLGQLSIGEVAAFTAYINRVKDAGVRLQVDSLPADKIKQNWRIFYDPLLLNATGARIDGEDDAPVTNAIKEYLKKLPFNGVYVRQYHIDAVQVVEGVIDCELDQCTASYGLLPFTSVDVFYTPDAGYLRFYEEADLTLEFIPHNVIR